MNILAFIQPGTNSRSIMLDCARGFERGPNRLFLWELAPMWNAYQRHGAFRPQLQGEFSALVKAFIEANRIDVSIGMWANTLLSLQNTLVPGDGGAGGAAGGRVVSFFDAIDHPHVLLWLDAPHWAHGGDFRQHLGTSLVHQKRVHHLINNPETAHEMREVLGFSNVIARRYGVNEEIFRPYPELEKSFDIVFGSGPGDPAPSVGALEELESDDPDMMRVRKEAAEAVLSEVRDIASGRGPAFEQVMKSLVGMQIERRDEPMLTRLERLRAKDAGLGAAIDTLLADPRLFVRATMAVRGVERFERAFTVSFLSRRFKCAVFGSGDLSAWGCRAHRFGELAYADQAKVYGRGRIGLNVGRWQDDAGMNLKPFEITASGAACLCAWRAGFDDCFKESDEAVSFRSPIEAAGKARELLESPATLAAIAERGHARTLADHTWGAWARDILSGVLGTSAR